MYPIRNNVGDHQRQQTGDHMPSVQSMELWGSLTSAFDKEQWLFQAGIALQLALRFSLSDHPGAKIQSWHGNGLPVAIRMKPNFLIARSIRALLCTSYYMYLYMLGFIKNNYYSHTLSIIAVNPVCSVD